MADGLPTIWEGAPHTFAKHQILKTYFKAWMPILSKFTNNLGQSGHRLLFVDGFAGPGSYAGGEDGSPILALESVLTHSRELPVPVSFLFIEQDDERFSELNNAINNYKNKAKTSSRIKSISVKHGDCETILNMYLDNVKKVGPALFFLDQFGFSDVSMDLIKRIMSQPFCEVFSYLNWNHMNRFLSDKTKWPSITKAYGGEEWRKVFSLENRGRADFMLNTYKTALEKRAGSKYIWHFAMCDRSDKLLYWLFFCTNNLRGVEEMKRAMWKVDVTGGFRFSDKDNPSQLNLFVNYNSSLLANDLISSLGGNTLTVFQVKEFVLTETPAYLYKKALKMLEDKDLLRVSEAPLGRRKGTFSDDYMHQMKLTFSSSLHF